MLIEGGICMKKKILALFMCAVMVIGIFPVYVFAEDCCDWRYTVLSEEDKTAEITGYNGTETELVFPEEIDGYTMVAIADEAFEYEYAQECPFISITIPETYKRIGNNNFYDCANLTAINLPHSLEFIGRNTFVKTNLCVKTMNHLGATKQPKVFYIGEYLIYADQNGKMPDCYTVKPGTKLIASGAFINCTKLKKVILPEGLEFINKGAFMGCGFFSSIVIPNTVKRIDQYVFAVNYSMKAIVIPASVEYIDESAFGGSDLQFLTVYGVAGTLAETFAKENGVTFVELKDVIYGDVDEDGTVTIMDYASTKSCVIGENVFKGCAEIIGDMNSDCVIDAFDLFQIDKTINN